MKNFNFEDEAAIDRAVANSNVVINLVGPRKGVKKLADAEYINIELSKKIARACARNSNVVRYI